MVEVTVMFGYPIPASNKKEKKKRGRPKNSGENRDYKPDVSLGREEEDMIKDTAKLLNPEQPIDSRAFSANTYLMEGYKREFRKACYREACKIFNDRLDSGLPFTEGLRIEIGSPASRIHKTYPIFHKDATIEHIERYYRNLAKREVQSKIEDIEAEVNRFFN